MGSQWQDHFVNLKCRRDWEVSVHTTHTSRSQSRSGSHLSPEENKKAMQLEIDHLKRKLRHERRTWTPSNFDFSSNDDEDGSYRPRSRTPFSESFSYDEDYHHKCRNRNPSSKGLNDAMSIVLNQISRSPFTRRIEGGRLPRWFTQPMFIMYNGQTDPVEHVSHFNQRMAMYSKNEALMCKVFLSSLGPVAMRWFWWPRCKFHWFL